MGFVQEHTKNLNFHHRTIFPILGQKKTFLKITFCLAQLHMDFYHHAKIYKKSMVEFQENAWTERQTEVFCKEKRLLAERSLVYLGIARK